MSFDLKAIAVNAVLILFTILVLFAFLRLLVYKPLRKIMGARAERVRVQLEQAQSAYDTANAMRDGMEREIHEKTEKAAEIAADSERKAERRASEIMRDAQDKAEALLSETRAQVEKERRTAIEHMRADIADMSVQIARKVLEREVSAADNQHIIDEYFRKVS